MGPGKKDFIVDGAFFGLARLIFIIIGWNRMGDARLPSRRIEHPVRGEVSTGGSQLLCAAVCLHHLVNGIVPTGAPPWAFNGGDML